MLRDALLASAATRPGPSGTTPHDGSIVEQLLRQTQGQLRVDTSTLGRGLDALSRDSATADLAGQAETRLTPVERGQRAGAADTDAALRSGEAGRSPEETRAIGEAFRRDLDRAPTTLPASAGPVRQAQYADLRRAGEFALLASDVYSDASNPALLPRGYTALSDVQAQRQFPGFKARDDQSGFYSRVYHDRSTNTYVVANRGTNDASAVIGILRRTPDGKTNGDLIAGNTTRQANIALRNARSVVRKSDEQVQFAGHSLGGALASLQAMQTGKKAVVFNPLGINVRAADRYILDMNRLNISVRSYQVSGEPVATANRALGLHTSRQTTVIDSREISWSANDGFRTSAGAKDPHSMVAVIAGVLDGMVTSKSGDDEPRLAAGNDDRARRLWLGRFHLICDRKGCPMTEISDRDRIIDLLGYFPNDASPLSQAVLCDDSAQVDAALKAGADPNGREPGGETPVLIASAIPRTEILKRLLRAGGNPNAYETDTETLALSYAMSAGVHYDDWSAWTVLLDGGADINFRPPNGSTIAEDAVSLGGVAKIPELLDRGYRNDLAGLARDLENVHYNATNEPLRLKVLEKVRARATRQGSTGLRNRT